MPKLSRESVVAEALALLDEVGLDGISTRRLANRLGVEQPSLYWHFRRKSDLLEAMAGAAMAPRTVLVPSPGDDWRQWFLDNHRDFRRALLGHRDGARLHAGTFPRGDDLNRAMLKLEFLVTAGIPKHEAAMAMLAASRFTVGSVLEQQASEQRGDGEHQSALQHEEAFEIGLRLLVDGLGTYACGTPQRQ